MKYRWGIIATGNIASSMAEALQVVPEAELLAVASRSLPSAQQFAQQWQIPRAYGFYNALLNDAEVDVVYIATPHSAHFESIMAALQAGKSVLCEKPLALNAQQAEQCIQLARQKQCFLMEAMWMRFFPAIQQVKQWVQEGVIGRVRLLQADFCIQLPFDPEHRLYNPELGGGALLDLGIYPLSLASLLLGQPETVHAEAILGQTGVDEVNSLLLRYPGGALAQLSSSMILEKPNEAFILGDKGSIKIHERFFCPEQLTLDLFGQEPQVFTLPYPGNGYVTEVQEVHRCLDRQMPESTTMPLDESLQTLCLMDQLLERFGTV